MKHLIKQLAFCTAAALMPLAPAYAIDAQASVEKTVIDRLTQIINEPDQAMFAPPEGWLLADNAALPPSVKIMMVGKGKNFFPPSINLAAEKYNGSLKNYLKIIRKINESKGLDWKDLGSVETVAGKASLSQVDTPTEWGQVRMMHVLIQHNKTMYIMTTAALVKEFPDLYKIFFEAIRSLRINPDAFAMIENEEQKQALQQACDKVKQGWIGLYSESKNVLPNESDEILTKATFDNDSFQKDHWKPFQELVERDFSEMHPVWKNHLLNLVRDELLQTTQSTAS